MCARFARGGGLLLLFLLLFLVPPVSAQNAAAPAPDPERGDLVAAPEPVTLLLVQPETAPVRPELESALRIQLRGTAAVEVQRAPWPEGLPARVAEAQRLSRKESAEWVMWADPPVLDPESATRDEIAVVYIVGRREGRALIEVVRVPGGEGPDVDRSLALKVHELIAANEAAAYALGNAELPPAVDRPSPLPAAPATRVGLFLEGGVQLASEGNAGAAFDLALAAGPGLRTPSYALDVPIELQVGLPRSVEDARGEVSWSETSIGLSVRAALVLSRALRTGAFAGGALVFANAEGRSPSGMTGEATELLPGLQLGLDAELSMTRMASVRLALGLTQRFTRQRFAIDRQDVADLGRLVPQARLSLLFRAL